MGGMLQLLLQGRPWLAQVTRHCASTERASSSTAGSTGPAEREAVLLAGRLAGGLPCMPPAASRTRTGASTARYISIRRCLRACCLPLCVCPQVRKQVV